MTERVLNDQFVGKKKNYSQIAFLITLGLILALVSVYLYNIVEWRNYPDFGFGFRTSMGVGVVGTLRAHGEKSGLESGDRLLSVNGKTFGTINEYRSALNRELGQKNEYFIRRRGQELTITVVNVPIGIKGVLAISGLTYIVGVCYILIGTLIFLMKRHHKTSWIFFLFCSSSGIFFMFFRKLGVMKPFDLENFVIFTYTFIPALVIHLALTFPEERKIIIRHPGVQFIPYLVSTTLFIYLSTTIASMMDKPGTWFLICMIYLAIGLLLLFSSSFQLWLTSRSEIVKLRSKMILLGSAIAFSVPISETLINSVFRVYILPSLNFFLPFFIIFPAFIGYSIVKYNLFDIDAIIKRTYGYILTTLAISGIYILVLAVFNYFFGSLELTESPVFTLIFLLAVVFLFNPVRNRVQQFIDAVFYRLEYDYQETVGKISETLRSLLSLDEIEKRIMENSAGIMFAESGSLLLLNPKEMFFEALTNSSALKIPADDPLMQKMSFRKKEVTLYDIQEDPFYVNIREACRRVFKLLEAVLIVPMIYEDRLIGLISLGKKKSGKFFRREHIKLLKILANQGAVAVQNARLADQMKNEEAVRSNLARYLSPQIVDQIIRNNVQVNLGGDKKVVTVLFSDIRSFTRISETLPPDKLVQLLNEYFTEMARIIFQNQGSLDKYIGDAIVAVFGSLITLYNPARAAVQAAIQMMKSLETANQRWTTQYGIPIQIGIGINTGEVFLGNIGSPERMEFTVIGDTVNIASRFSGVASPGQILVAKDTLDCLGSDLNHRKLLPVEVKGKKGKLEVFEIIYS